MDIFFLRIPAKLVFLLAAYLSCSLTISFFVVSQDLLSKIYSMLFPFLQKELLNYQSSSAISLFHSALHNDCYMLCVMCSSPALT